ncbi:MAG: hypothetical protein IJY42_03050 [Clostridia bacterium]|nr:hypothetical protein [Clostridia bacterium]
MNAEQTPNQSYGYLIVRVSTARGALPLGGVSVKIRGSDQDSSGVIASFVTDSDGKTPRIALPTPNRSASEHPGNARPYATYSVDVLGEGYLPAYFEEVPVFPSVLSIQPAVLVPQSGVNPPAVDPVSPDRPLS